MLKCIIVLVVFMMVDVVQAEPKSNSYKDLNESTTQCDQNEHSCWKSYAERLAQLKAPANEEEREAQMFDYWGLSQITKRVGDYGDSAKYYAVTLDLIKAFPPGMTISHLPPDFWSAAVKADIGALDLIVKDYSGALNNLDDFIKAMKREPELEYPSDEVMLQRCVALIGLKRANEADLALQQLLQKLDFNGRRPQMGWPFNPINPYDATRRIAAHWTQEGKYERALALLQTIQTKRQQAIAHHSKEKTPNVLWATTVGEPDILDDEAAVYLTQHRDDQAEPLLRASLQMREKVADKHLTRTLTMLVALERRKGAISEADAFAAHIIPAKAREAWELPDPLAETLSLEY